MSRVWYTPRRRQQYPFKVYRTFRGPQKSGKQHLRPRNQLNVNGPHRNIHTLGSADCLGSSLRPLAINTHAGAAQGSSCWCLGNAEGKVAEPCFIITGKINGGNSSLTSLASVTLGQTAALDARPSHTVNNKEEAAAASWVIPAALVGKVLEIMEITRKCHDNTTENVPSGD